MSILLSLSDTSATSNDFIIPFDSHLKFDAKKQWEIALISSTIYYVFPNVSSGLGNNKFSYYNGTTTRNLTIPDGLYNIDNINSEIHRQMVLLSDNIANLILAGNYSTNRVRIELDGGYTVDLTVADSFRELLGFSSVVVSTTQEGSGSANLSRDVEKILIHCSLIRGNSYVNSVSSDIISDMLLNQPPGSQISYRPSPPIWLPAKSTLMEDISEIRVYFTDQLNRAIDFLGEPTSITLQIRELK